ncbi:aminopeptidase P isoform X3 [Lycorma delicatula]
MTVKKTGQLLKKLRCLFKNSKYIIDPLQAYIVPHGDAHQSEYTAPSDERLAFISGFTGSAGTAVISEYDALLWTDGRYFLQASSEMDENWTLMKEGILTTPTLSAWLSKNLPNGSYVGADPHLVSYLTWSTLSNDLQAAGINLVPVNINLVDLIWDDQPSPPSSVVHPLSMKYTGKSGKDKVEEVRSMMAKKGAELFIVCALDEVAWLLNLRGSDIQYNPVFFSYVAVTPKKLHFFIDESKLSPAVRNHFNEENLSITVHPYDKIQPFISEQVSRIEENDGKVWISQSTSYAPISVVPKKLRLLEVSPVALLKAIKNDVEIQGMINAHIKDAAALCCYFAWLEKEVAKGQLVTEVSGAKKLDSLRSKQEDFVGLSFETMSSVGPHGAIIHYHPSLETDRQITTEELYLCDSGGQYKDGTTDVTRTLHFGTPSEFEKECFTRVFKGQVALGTSVFPHKLLGNSLDPRARKFLWDVGLDYSHGTGHGVGAYLNVHEGPFGISWRPYVDDPGLQEGMFLSNEPGYYEDGKFGIRLENVMRIVKAKTPYNFTNKTFLTFETVTFVPIQTKMLLPDLLTQEEITYLNDYHNACREKVGPLLKEMGYHEAIEWLYRETEPIG